MTETLSPGLALVAYAEPLIDGKRVAVLGDASAALGEELVARGARLVHVYDVDAARAAAAAAANRHKKVTIGPLDEADVAIRDGAFDVVLVPDLSDAEDPARLLVRVRRALSPRGAALVASPNPDARLLLLPGRGPSRRSPPLGYYALFDAVSAELPEVRMLGQTPFVGYAVVDFAPDREPDVTVDSAFLPGNAEEPEWFVALAARTPVRLGAFGIVQLPAARTVGRSADAALGLELQSLKGERDRASEQVTRLEQEVARLREAPDALAQENARLAADLEAARWSVDELEGRLERGAPGADRRALDAAHARIQEQAVLLAQARTVTAR